MSVKRLTKIYKFLLLKMDFKVNKLDKAHFSSIGSIAFGQQMNGVNFKKRR